MSTDSDPPADDEQVRKLVRDELANALEEADIDLDKLPQEDTATRREVLKAAGLAGAVGITGAGGMNAATQPASAGGSSAGNWGTKDNPGDFFSEDHFAVDQAVGGLSTPPTGFVNFGFENGEGKYVDDAGNTQAIAGALTDGNDDGVYTLPSATDGINVGSVATDYASTNSVMGGVSINANPKSEAAKTLPAFPTAWTKYTGNPIITGVTATSSQAAFPSFFHADRYLSSPLDSWYIYWAGHDDGGIRLHTAPDITGPWTSQGQVVSATGTKWDLHISSPEVVWDATNSRINLYLHGEENSVSPNSQGTTLMTSTGSDGTSFTEQGDVLTTPRDGTWDDNERSYMSVTRAGGVWYGLYNGRDQFLNNKALGLAWSPDGSAGSWNTLNHPVFKNQYIVDDPEFAYDPRADQQGPGGNLVQFGGQLWVCLYYGASPTTRKVKAVRLDHYDQGVVPSLDIIEATEAWEGDSLEIGDFMYADDRLYMLYNSYDSSDSSRDIGLAYVDLEDYQ